MTIQGAVNAQLETLVEITVRGAGGRSDQTIRAIIDTGFDRYLSLPPQTVAELDLPYAGKEPFDAFGGVTVVLNIHHAIVDFGGVEQGISCIAADNPPLIGMALLRGYELCLKVADGGTVTLRKSALRKMRRRVKPRTPTS